MKSIRYLNYKGDKIPYEISFKKQQNIILKLQQDRIVISAPFDVEDWQIERFIYTYIVKIIKFWEEHKLRDNYKIDLIDGHIKILGIKTPANFITQGNPNKNKLEFKIYEDQKETIKKMYSKMSLMYYSLFESRVKIYSKEMEVIPKNIFVRNLRGKWGVCFSNESRVGFNIALIHYQIEVIDSVVVHELAHLKHKNHSRDFKNFVLNYYPDYNKWQKSLNGK
ncbi:M48 family metallopeptidase [Spiroplasma endosymbiont of Aspidapion aeneum]|uniref:M48 family metallopeptidase n=1 Tax=Spiroplasma endosymbiont of Aspidapion aeneum TaxID=3066276 RepID=UPI00313ADC9F